MEIKCYKNPVITRYDWFFIQGDRQKAGEQRSHLPLFF
ncbi:hypothetical protein EPIR_0337 [Erwinia piriflorinigrans CFBP 5888]|uniref:Uncharacterized protein n=1 Tax=Erwinia piriflorinigrans CFBP 5888 TaxID=1161919 RepID=V5Z359_9GAMM|nr:hypothetical protein EPIR_0337 [Erwinia piriflorinigrans CFBP 5888]